MLKLCLVILQEGRTDLNYLYISCFANCSSDMFNNFQTLKETFVF